MIDKEIITKEDLLREIDFVSERMRDLSDLIQYYAGFDKEVKEKADQLKGASAILAELADRMEDRVDEI